MLAAAVSVLAVSTTAMPACRSMQPFGVGLVFLWL
jgi:hypothetical protein